MMRTNRKPTPFRGPALLLTLALGAGLALSGCSDDSAPAPAPTPAPTPAPPDPTLGAPSGLKVADTGANFIEFSWDAVEGATGYEIQLSRTAGDFSSVSTATVTGTMHKFEVEPETTAYARVRATAAGVSSDWSDSVTGASMAAPIVLGVPLPRVSGTGPDHIEWSWAAVPEAQEYQVQVADSAAGLADAPTISTPGTTHRVSADPETAMYIRVRAAVTTPMAAAGAWSAAVEGMSAAAPTTLTVSMTPPDAEVDSACSGQIFCPDNGTDPASAMATVNPRLMVTSSHPAEVSPMFITGASAVGLGEGESTPFTRVSWPALQRDIARDGATFRFERISIGAGPEPAAGGEVVYITCGPFRCSDFADEIPPAPDITISDSAACTGFEAEFTLNVGAVRNGIANMRPSNPASPANGLDIGWTYTSTGPATVTHVFAHGLEVKAPEITAGTSREQGMSMARPGGNENNPQKINDFGGIEISRWYGPRTYGAVNQIVTTAGPIRNAVHDCFPPNDGNGPGEAGHWRLGDSRDSGNERGGWIGDAWRVDRGTYSLFGVAGTTGGVERPQGRTCARIVLDDTSGCASKYGTDCGSVTHSNYLDGYSLEVQPQASVTWAGSRVDWPEGADPFEGLDCEGFTVAAADQVDVCELFEEEVDRYWGQGRVANVGTRDDFGKGSEEWRLRPIFADDLYEGTRTLVALQVARNVEAPPGIRGMSDTRYDAQYIARPRGSRFLSLWLSDTTKTAFASDHPDRIGDGANANTLGIDRTRSDRNLYYPSPRHAFQEWISLRPFGIGVVTTAPHHAAYNVGDDGGSNTGEAAQRAILTFPMFDDEHHKLHGDFGKTDFDDNGEANNFASDFWERDRECDATDGGEEACDVDGVEFSGEVTFVMHRDSSVCAQTREISVTCDWDADGDRGRYDEFRLRDIDKFITCRSN